MARRYQGFEANDNRKIEYDIKENIRKLRIKRTKSPMRWRNMKNMKALIINILIPVSVGALSALLTRNSMDVYERLIQPPLAPPSWVFPVVWTTLFILMGISAYLVYKSDSLYRKSALKIYGIQLVVNFFWTIIFFNLEMYLFAFVWLLLLLVSIIFMIISFSKVNKKAAYLQIPYLLWVCFAGYLNLAIYLLNK